MAGIALIGATVGALLLLATPTKVFDRLIPLLILAATLLNHGAAGALGAWLTSLASPELMRWVLGVSFIAMAGWMLIPDKFDEEGAAQLAGRDRCRPACRRE